MEHLYVIGIDYGTDSVRALLAGGSPLPPDLALMIKAFITLEGMGRQLDPDFDMAGEAAPFLEQVLLAHAAPDALVRRGWRSLGRALALVAGLTPEALHASLAAEGLQPSSDTQTLGELAGPDMRRRTRILARVLAAGTPTAQ